MTDGRERDRGRPWVCLEDRRGDPELEARRRREFLEPLPEPLPVAVPGDDAERTDAGDHDEPSGTSRRDFAKLLGFSLAAAGCSRAPVKEAVPFVELPEGVTPGVPLHYATTCGGCSAACPVVVKTRDGRPIKVEGNRMAPATGGGTCAVGQATVLSLYDEARLRGPRWRAAETTWSELDRRVRRRLAAARAAGGRIAVVTGTVVSPTTRRLLEEFVEHHDARWVSWDPVSAAAVRRAHELGFGRSVVPSYRLEHARAVVGLEADFLGTWLAPVEQSHGYGRGRKLPGRNGGATEGGAGPDPGADTEMLWHGQFESRLSPTGANADLRVPVEASEIGAVAVALLARLERRAGRPVTAPPTAENPPEIPAEDLDRTADRLWHHRGASLVLCGVADPAVQQVVCEINRLVAAFGTTVDLEHPSQQRAGDEEAFDELIDEMRRGEIHALLLWGVNPAYHHPRAAEFLAGLDRVALSVACADRLDETASRVDAVAPDHHFLEAWNDAEPVAGRLSLSQPTTAPLFDTRAAQASLLAWMDREPDWLGYLRRRWRREVFPRQDHFADFDAFWHRSLHDGLPMLSETPLDLPPEGVPLEGAVVEPRHDAAAAVAAVLAEVEAGRERRRDGGFELILHEKVGLRDGRWANVPWLQELPDPVTRATWGNHAALAPQTAERLGLEDGDEVRLEVDGERVELPAVIQPGQARATVAVALGYGRRAAGPVADGVGVDAFPLVDTSRGLHRYHRTGVALTATGRRRRLAATQTHHVLEGRPIVHETTLAAWRRDPAAASHATEHGEGAHGGAHGLPSLWPERPEKGHAWGMAVDLNACTGCAACVVACQAENNVPVVGPAEVERGREMHWLRIDRYYRGSPERPDTVFQPMMCQHCDNAPCETVCPVLATVHSSDGLNQQIYNRCVGTRYCANNCPYKVRRFNWFTYARNESFDYHLNSDLGSMVLNPDVVVRSRGVMEKCSMCIQRIQEGKLTARDAGRRVRDGDIVPACQQACPTEALTFGDWMDSDSRLAHLGRDPRFYHVLEELGVRPSVGYLAKVRNRDEDAHAAEEG